MPFEPAHSPIRTLGRALKRAPERLLHPIRRRRSHRRLRALGVPASILVVCRGNICRSPFGERYLERLFQRSGLDVHVRSAGFMSGGRCPPSDAQEAAAEHGLDLSDHRSAILSAAAVRDSDVVLVMEPVHARLLIADFPEIEPRVFLLGDFDPDPVIELRTVRDPIKRGLDEYRHCYRRMARCLRCLVANYTELATPRGSPRSAGETATALPRRAVAVRANQGPD